MIHVNKGLWKLIQFNSESRMERTVQRLLNDEAFILNPITLLRDKSQDLMLVDPVIYQI